MSKPLTHAQNNVEKYGGKVSDYLTIHTLIDSSKAALGDKRHRAATHNSWFIYTILPQIFGEVLTNSNGKEIAVTQIGEDHVLEDYDGKFIPTLEDWLLEIPLRKWMNNGEEYPPSSVSLAVKKTVDEYKHIDVDLRNMPLDIRKDKYEPIIGDMKEIDDIVVFYKSIASD